MSTYTPYQLDDDGIRSVHPDAYQLDDLMVATLAPIRHLETLEEGEEPRLEPWERTNIPEKTFQDLQWDQLVEHLSSGAVSPEGYLLTRAMTPLEDIDAVRRRMTEISECQALLGDDDAPPLRGLSDIRKALSHTQRGGVLVGQDLYAIARNCDVASRCARYFRNRTTRAPYLAEPALELDSCDELRQILNHAVEPDGALSDHASPDLGRLRRSVQNQHDRIRAQVDKMLRSRELDHFLQDDYYTMREDRYVLPVRRGGKSGIPGIVHGYSSSGQTAFIEPNEMIELNNQLRWAQIELQEEIDRVLARLSQQVARYASSLLRTSDILAYLDFVYAAASLSQRLRATVPTLGAGAVALRHARHPLLYLKFAREIDGEEVNDTVPNDTVLEDGKRILIVSGPNTGGKTVLLKTLGLCSLMARCGLPLPVEEGSHMPLFRAIYTDIGDEQSIEHDLSTFSGHLTNINTFVEECDGDSLILLDELFTGTDPLQGAALAVALLEELNARGSRCVVTTHLESLKTLAFQKDAYANASMGFALDTLSPTYQVTYGLPGSSYAIRIAQRLGFPSSILDRAHAVLDGQEHQSVEDILTSLEDKRVEMEREQRRLNHLRRESEGAKRKYERKYERLLTREKDMLHERSRTLKRELDKAHDLLRTKLRELRRIKDPTITKVTQQDLEQMRAQLDGAAETIERSEDYARPVEPGPSGMARVQPDEIEEGMEVYVHSFKRKGTVSDFSSGGSDVAIQIGPLKVRVGLDDLYYATDAQRRTHVHRARVEEPVGAAAPVPMLLPQTSDNTVDLRGARVDEAIEKLELYLDSAYLSNLRGVYIIHGHGTGALKRAVRGYLPTSEYVDEFRRGERTEGGDGVTIAFLKA